MWSWMLVWGFPCLLGFWLPGAKSKSSLSVINRDYFGEMAHDGLFLEVRMRW